VTDDRSPIGLRISKADVHLAFLAVRCRPMTVLAAAYDLKMFFAVVGKVGTRSVRPMGDPQGREGTCQAPSPSNASL